VTRSLPTSRSRLSRRTRVLGLVLAPVVAVPVAYVAWSAPRDQVALPGPDATPEQVVRAYVEALDARDFDTVNAIDGRPGSDLDRFDRPGQIHLQEMGDTFEGDPNGTHVMFQADFEGFDISMEDGWWGYYLVRGADGRWEIVDEGVA